MPDWITTYFYSSWEWFLFFPWSQICKDKAYNIDHQYTNTEAEPHNSLSEQGRVDLLLLLLWKKTSSPGLFSRGPNEYVVIIVKVSEDYISGHMGHRLEEADAHWKLQGLS